MNNGKLVIGLSGLKQSGKDYTASVLQKTLRNYGLATAETKFKVHKFAARLYEYVNAVLLCDHAYVENMIWSDFKRTKQPFDMLFAEEITRTCFEAKQTHNTWEHNKPRGLLQYIGTEVFREMVDCDYWINIVRADIEETDANVVIFTDVRFANEAELCQIVIKILGGIAGDSHSSEGQVLPWDYLLDNTAKDPVLHGTRVAAIVSDMAKHTPKQWP